MQRLAAFAAASLFAAAALANAPVGRPAPAFTVSDLTGKPVRLEDYKGKTVVLEWINFGCPFVMKHYNSGNMQALQKKYSSDVVWLAVNSTNKGHSDWADPAPLTAQLKQLGAQPARYLVDEPGTMGLAYGAKTTPHMYIVNPEGVLIYKGAIDDKPSTNKSDIPGARNHVLAALDESMAGKPVSTPSTTPYGCSVKYQ